MLSSARWQVLLWGLFASALALLLFPGIPSSDYFYQKAETFGVLTSWHPILLSILLKFLSLLNPADIDQWIYVIGLLLFYCSLYYALDLRRAGYLPFAFTMMAVFAYYPFWFFVKSIWKDTYFVAFYLLACGAILRLDVLQPTFKAVGLLSVFSALAMLSRHNAVACLGLSIVVSAVYFHAGKYGSPFWIRLVSLISVVLIFSYGIKFLAEQALNVKSPGSMTNLVIAFDNYGALAKLADEKRQKFIRENPLPKPEVAARAIGGYKHSAPSDYLYWGAAPSLSVPEELASNGNVVLFNRILVKQPVALLDFKSDIFLQLVGATRYDFMWSPYEEEGRAPIPFVGNFLNRIHSYTASSEANIYGNINALNALNYLFVHFFVASVALVFLYFKNPSGEGVRVATAWIFFGLTSVLPYLLLTPGIFYRYEAAAHACFLVGTLVSMRHFLGKTA